MLIDSMYTPETKIRAGISHKENNFNSVISNIAYSLRQQRVRGKQLTGTVCCKMDTSLISEKFKK